MTMELPQTVTISESALIQKVSGEMVILDMESGQYYTLNEVASDMLDHLQAGLNLDAVVVKICEKYEATTAEVTNDLNEMLITLLEKQLVQPA